MGLSDEIAACFSLGRDCPDFIKSKGGLLKKAGPEMKK